MTDNKQVATKWEEAVILAKPRFVAIAGEEKWVQESMFAAQAIRKNPYLGNIANNNPQSLQNAIINVAAIGLTLNPAYKYAYIVPRDGAACLDISYMGLMKLATDSGAIKWIRTELVYKNDTFIYNGPHKEPEHHANVFADESERGEFVGVYCIAKTHEDEILVETMTAKEIYKVRDKSPAYAKSKSGPWADWFDQMTKKTIIKRASKFWPQTDKNKLPEAIEILNEQEGIIIDEDAIDATLTKEEEETIVALLGEVDVDIPKFLSYFHAETVADIKSYDYGKAVSMLKSKAQ